MWCCSLLVAALIFAGCGDAGPANAVSGKVTLNGEPVAGSITFVGADGKEVSSPVGPGGGTYNIVDPPQGEVTVLIKGPGIAATPELKPAPGAMAMPSGTDKGANSMGVNPPAKYADASGGLKYTVRAGRQTKDFELTP